MRHPALPPASNAVLGFALALAAGAFGSQAQAASLTAEGSGLNLDLLTVRRSPDLADPRRAPYSFTASLMLSQGGSLGLSALRESSAARSHGPDDSNHRLLSIDPTGRPLFDDKPSLGPRLRFEGNGQRLEVRPRRSSIWIQYSREFQ